MVVEDEKVMDVMMILNSKYETDRDSDVFLTLLIQVKRKSNIMHLKQLENWQKNYFLRIFFSIEIVPEDPWDGFTGKFEDDFLKKGLPMPNGDEVVILAVKEENLLQVCDKIKIFGFENFIAL